MIDCVGLYVDRSAWLCAPAHAECADTPCAALNFHVGNQVPEYSGHMTWCSGWCKLECIIEPTLCYRWKLHKAISNMQTIFKDAKMSCGIISWRAWKITFIIRDAEQFNQLAYRLHSYIRYAHNIDLIFRIRCTLTYCTLAHIVVLTLTPCSRLIN